MTGLQWVLCLIFQHSPDDSDVSRIKNHCFVIIKKCNLPKIEIQSNK